MSNTKNTNVLGVENKIYECGFCKKQPETLIVPWEIYSQWLMISHKMGKLEWGAVGKVADGKVISFTIPKQEVTGTECEFKEELGGNLHVHSHHTMGAFASGTDYAHVLSNFEYSLILSAVDYKAFKKTALPCGGYGYANVTVTIEGMPFNGNVMEKISEKEYKPFVTTPSTDWHLKSLGMEDINYIQEELEFDSLACHVCENEDANCNTCKLVPVAIQEKWGVGLSHMGYKFSRY